MAARIALLLLILFASGCQTPEPAAADANKADARAAMRGRWLATQNRLKAPGPFERARQPGQATLGIKRVMPTADSKTGNRIQ